MSNDLAQIVNLFVVKNFQIDVLKKYGKSLLTIEGLDNLKDSNEFSIIELMVVSQQEVLVVLVLKCFRYIPETFMDREY